jgi:predicted NBD/HSP70 family sugar kinase
MDNLRVGSKQLIKDINRALVVKEVRDNGPISRSELARRTGLVLSTITKLCDELVAENLLFEFGEGKSTGGRRPVNLMFNNSYGYTIGVKVEDSSVVFSLANLKPTILKHDSIAFPVRAPVEEVMPLILRGITAMVAEIPQDRGQPAGQHTSAESGDRGRLLGIGVAVSGLVDPDSGVLRYSSLLGWKDVELAAIIGPEFDTVVRADNDVNCYALAQNWLGKGKESRNFVCITIGEGIGSGVIVENQLYRGAAGGAGEIGHMIVSGGGRACYCGQKGCLEAYASTNAIIDAVASKKGSRHSIEEVVELARLGDADCRGVLSEAGRAIGWGLVNVVMQYNPEKIILGGEGIAEGEFILPSIIEELDRNWFNTRTAFSTRLEIDDLGNENFLLGASILVLSDLLGQPIYNEKRTLVAGK